MQRGGPRYAWLARLAGRCGPRDGSPQQPVARGPCAGQCGAGASPHSPEPAVGRPLAAGRLPRLPRDPSALRPAAGAGREHGGCGEAPEARHPAASPPQRPPGRHLMRPAASARRIVEPRGLRGARRLHSPCT